MTTTPIETAPSSPTTAPAAPAASSTAAPTPNVFENVFGSEWEQVDFGGNSADARAAAYGENGAVIVGARCVGPSDRPECTAAAWHRTIDRAWEPSKVEDAAGATIWEVAFAGTYVALGSRIERGAALVRAIIWESRDGAEWSVKGSVEIGDCSGEGPTCGHAERLTVAESGLILIGDVYAAGSDPYHGALRSADGKDWVEVQPTAFGDLDASIAAAVPIGDGVVGLVSGGDTPMTAWRSTDAASWTQFSEFGDVAQSIGALAGNDDLLVAAEGQSASARFRTTLWTSESGRPFDRRATFDDVILTKLADTGPTGFIGVGHDEGRPQVIASPDGFSWYRVAPGLPQIECAPSSLAGAPLEALYVGSCGVWATHQR